MINRFKAYYKSPIGALEIIGGDTGVSMINFCEQIDVSYDVPICLQKCIDQLDEYFAGTRKNFDLILNLSGTIFQEKVWNALSGLTYGQVVSYKDIATSIGNVKAVRAIGNANHHNPIPIIIPCHRVVGAKGDLTGYAGGLWRKKWLLEHEARYKN